MITVEFSIVFMLILHTKYSSQMIKIQKRESYVIKNIMVNDTLD